MLQLVKLQRFVPQNPLVFNVQELKTFLIFDKKGDKRTVSRNQSDFLFIQFGNLVCFKFFQSGIFFLKQLGKAADNIQIIRGLGFDFLFQQRAFHLTALLCFGFRQ